jgi:hypothetical protein
MGPTTYEVFERSRNLSIGDKLYPSLRDRKKFYSEKCDIYPIEYPEGCFFGYLVKRNDPTKTIVGWKIISGKEYCKQQQGYILSF